jgi:Fur family transcriptional regulator, zinc uptake regulator
MRGTFADGREHDHSECVADALARASAICGERGTRLTEMRRRVLELVWSRHRPTGAYDILGVLNEERTTAPPTVYRALDFLVQHGLVHRIASLNAYIGCDHPGAAHRGQFLICQRCRNIAEIRDSRITHAIAATASSADFQVGAETIEISGLCRECRTGTGSEAR